MTTDPTRSTASGLTRSIHQKVDDLHRALTIVNGTADNIDRATAVIRAVDAIDAAVTELATIRQALTDTDI